MQNKLPFLFARLVNPKDPNSTEIRDWVVKIASYHDLKVYDARWMCDSDLGDYAFVPDVDLCESVHIFTKFDDARDFVKNWWKDN